MRLAVCLYLIDLVVDSRNLGLGLVDTDPVKDKTSLAGYKKTILPSAFLDTTSTP